MFSSVDESESLTLLCNIVRLLTRSSTCFAWRFERVSNFDSADCSWSFTVLAFAVVIFSIISYRSLTFFNSSSLVRISFLWASLTSFRVCLVDSLFTHARSSSERLVSFVLADVFERLYALRSTKDVSNDIMKSSLRAYFFILLQLGIELSNLMDIDDYSNFNVRMLAEEICLYC